MTSRPAPSRQVAAACLPVLGLTGCAGERFGGSHDLRPELEAMLAATVYPRGTAVELSHERVLESFPRARRLQTMKPSCSSRVR